MDFNVCHGSRFPAPQRCLSLASIRHHRSDIQSRVWSKPIPNLNQTLKSKSDADFDDHSHSDFDSGSAIAGRTLLPALGRVDTVRDQALIHSNGSRHLRRVGEASGKTSAKTTARGQAGEEAKARRSSRA